MSINLRNLMSHAWAEARRAADQHGGRAADYFAEALRLAWADRRGEPTPAVAPAEMNVTRMTDVDLAGFNTHLDGRLAELDAASLGYDGDRAADVRSAQSSVQVEMVRRWRISHGCASARDIETPAEWLAAPHGFVPTSPALSSPWGVRDHSQAA